jgi:flagellar motor switch protein FliM
MLFFCSYGCSAGVRTLELFNEAVDRHHRSYVSAVLGRSPDTIRYQTTRTLMPIH